MDKVWFSGFKYHVNLVCHAQHIFTQFLVSAFIFTANFPENVISTQSLSTKLVRFSIFAQDFSVTISINFFEKIGEKLSA